MHQWQDRWIVDLDNQASPWNRFVVEVVQGRRRAPRVIRSDVRRCEVFPLEM